MKVDVKLGPKGQVIAGGGVSAVAGGGTLTLMMNAGDVAEVVGGVGQDYDFSGSLLTSDKPVQVITGVPCIDFPLDTQACDHVEETVLPVEMLGAHYVVMRPTGPKENLVGQIVHLVGNTDGTTLTYKPSAPPGCPSALAAGEVVDCGEVTAAFEVIANHPFGISLFLLGGEKSDPNFNPASLMQPQGDPSQSLAIPVERHRKRVTFFAPSDYKTAFADVIAETGTTVTLDGADVSSKLVAITGTTYFEARLKLDSQGDGAHALVATKPIGVQVIGYGDNTSYMYPAGLGSSRK